MSDQQPPDGQLSLAVLQHSANRFVRLAEVDSGRLAQHRANLAGMQLPAADGDAAAGRGQLKRELVNASRCVSQLKCRLQELQQLQAHVRPEDRAAFDRMVGPTVAMVTEQIRDFTQAYIDATVSLDNKTEAAATTSGSSSPTTAQVASYVFDDSPHLPGSTPALALEAATESLARDLADLEALMAQFSATVTAQAEGVASVEAAISRAEVNAESGAHWLRQAVRYRALYLPVAGAATGALLGGPVGMLIGLKAGAAAGLLGGVAGYAGGRLLTAGSTTDTTTASAVEGAAPTAVDGNSIEMKQLAPAKDELKAAKT